MPSPSKRDPKVSVKATASFHHGEARVQRGCDVPGLYYKLIIHQQNGYFGQFSNIGLSHDVKCSSPQIIVLISIVLPFVAEQIPNSHINSILQIWRLMMESFWHMQDWQRHNSSLVPWCYQYPFLVCVSRILQTLRGVWKNAMD